MKQFNYQDKRLESVYIEMDLRNALEDLPLFRVAEILRETYDLLDREQLSKLINL